MLSLEGFLAWLVFAIALGSCGSSSGNASDGGPFVAAQYPPPDPCGLLTFADIQTVSPNASGMYEPDPTESQGVSWMIGCWWADPTTTERIELYLTGALNPQFAANLDAHVEVHSAYPDASVDTVTGLGTKAAYLNQTGVLQTLNVRFKSYLITLDATGFVPDLPEASLRPLALKVMGEL
jgi:hypothetical protein